MQFQGRHSHKGSMYQSALIAPVTISSKRLQNINCIVPPSHDMGGLFLGDIVSTLKPELLRQNNIKAILSCLTEKQVRVPVFISNHKTLPLKDTLDFPIRYFFKQAAEWIHARRKEGMNVLVHCHAGISRSATIMIAYFIIFKGWTHENALDYICQKRERAKPNSNFWKQLTQFSQSQNFSDSVMNIQFSKVSQNSRKSEMVPVQTQSKENYQNFKRASQPIAAMNEQTEQGQPKRQRFITQKSNMIQHQPKSTIRKRKPIFDTPAIDRRQYRRHQIVSCESFRQQKNSSQLKKNPYSVVFSQPRQAPMNHSRASDPFQQNHSNLEYGVTSQQNQRFTSQQNQRYTVVPQQIKYQTPVQVNYLNPRPQTQPYVSPFELRGRFRNS